MIKIDYKLTQKINSELWLDFLRTELISNDLINVIDSDFQVEDNVGDLIKKINFVRHIIINHLDENYH